MPGVSSFSRPGAPGKPQLDEIVDKYDDPRYPFDCGLHSSLATTQKHYIKDVAENALAAMNRLRATRRGCEPTHHDKSEKARSIEAIKPTM
jgi:hypothetical protein